MSLRLVLTNLTSTLLLMACQENGAGPTAEEKKSLLVEKNSVAESRTLSPGFIMEANRRFGRSNR